MAESRWALRRRWSEASPYVKVAVVMIAAQTALRVWQVVPGSYWMDDFAYLWLARERGFTADLLLEDYNSHLMPAGFALNWVMASFPGSYLPAALTIVVLQLATSIMMFLLLRRAFGDSMGVIVGLAIYLFNPLMIASVTWWAAATQMLPLQLFMATTAYCHLRYSEGHQTRWLVSALGSLVLGLAFWEKGVLIPWFVGMVAILVIRRGPGQTLRDLTRSWPAWAGYLIITAAYSATYLALADVGGAAVQSFGLAVRFARIQLVDLLLPSFFGGPWRTPGFDGTTWPVNTVATRLLLLQVVALLAFVGWRLHGRRSLLAWGAVFGYVAVTMGITLRGRGYWGDAVALDPRYASDIIPIVCVAVAYLLTFEATGRSRMLSWVRSHQLGVGVVTSLVLFNSSMVSAGSMVDLYHRDHVEQFVTNARAELARNPNLVLFDGFLPSHVMIPWFAQKYRHVSSALDAYDIHPRYNLPTEDLRMLDDFGIARPVDLVFGSDVPLPGDNACALALSKGEAAALPLTKQLHDGTWWVRVDYFTVGRGELEITTAGGTVRAGLGYGPHHLYAMVQGPISTLTLKFVQGRGVVCFSDVEVGFPTPESP